MRKINCTQFRKHIENYIISNKIVISIKIKLVNKYEGTKFKELKNSPYILLLNCLLKYYVTKKFLT